MPSIADQLKSIISAMTPELQQELLDYAQYLRATRMDEAEPGTPPSFYICPSCFRAAEKRLVCHQHLMMPCFAESPEDCKPLMNSEGQLKSRAPRWFVKAVSRLSR